MSRIQSLLEILIRVQDQGLGNINKTQSAIKQLTLTELAYQKTLGNRRAQLKTIDLLQRQFIDTITNLNRRQLEQTKNDTRQARIDQQAIRAKRERRLAAAQLAIQTGNLELAERRLNQAMTLTRRGSSESIRIQQRLAQVQAQRARQAQEASRAQVRQALSEAAVARAAGSSAREIAILNRVLQRNDLEARQAAQAQLALARAQRRQARETERQRSRLALLRREMALLATITRGITRTFNIFTRVLAAGVLIGFTARTIGRTITRFIFDPLQRITAEILEATDAFRQMQASLLGVVGSSRAVRGVIRDVRTATQGLPVTTLEAISGVRGLAFTPGTAQLLQQSSDQRVPGIQNILRILTGLATIDPDQGIDGARFAVREALAGEFRSLRFRFELSPRVIASTIGASLEELKADPALTLRALRTFVDTFIGDDAIAEFNNLLSVQANRLRGALQEFFALIGEQGIFDRVTGVARRGADLIQRGILTPGDRRGSLAPAAALINDSLERLLDTILKTFSDALTRFTGVTVDLTNDLQNLDIENVGRLFARLVDQLALAASFVIGLIPDFQTAASRVGKLLGVEVGPVTRESIAARTDEIDTLINALTIDLGTQRGILSRPRRGGTLGGRIQVEARAERRIAEIEQELASLKAERLRLRERAALLNEFFRAPQPQSTFDSLRDSAKEAINAIGLFGTGLDQATQSLGGLADEQTLVGRAEQLGTIIEAQTQALINLLEQSEKAAENIRRNLGDEFGTGLNALGQGQIRQGLGNLARLIVLAGDLEKITVGQRTARAALDDTGLDSLLGVIQGSEGFTRQLPNLPRIRQTQDILSLFGATAPSDVQRALGSSQARGLGLDTQSIVGQRLESTRNRLGFGSGEILNAQLIDEIARHIDNIGDSVSEYTGDARIGARATRDLADQFIELFVQQREEAVSPLDEEIINVAIAKLQELRDEAEKTVNSLQEDFRDLAEGISQSLGDGLSDALVTGLEEGSDAALDVLEDMARQIQRIITRMIFELTVVRGLINPVLNSAFGLQGTNQLQTLAPPGARGMSVGAGRIRPLQRGLISGPTLFPLGGGQNAMIGEETPEFVLPARQDASGNVGVLAMGGGGRVLNVYMNITTPNADSFRKSRRQIQSSVRDMFA